MTHRIGWKGDGLNEDGDHARRKAATYDSYASADEERFADAIGTIDASQLNDEFMLVIQKAAESKISAPPPIKY